MARNKEMDPVLDKDRSMSCPKFSFSFASDVIAIFAFMTGAGAIAAGLSILQALMALTVALVFNVILLTLNGIAGQKYGIAMIVQCRPCFGEKAANYVAVIRAIPGIMWTGYNSFLGALGLNLFSIMLFGFDNIWIWFFVFHFAQVILSMMGVKKILNFTAYAAIALFVLIIIMGCYIFYLYGPHEVATAITSGGASFGMAFWGVVAANIALSITCIVNSSDYTRELKTKSVGKHFASWAMGLIPTEYVLAGLGMVVYKMSGIWSPVDLFVKYVPNFFIVIIAMAFIILGQFSTNMYANLIPTNLVFQNLFRFPWWFTSVFSGCLSLFIVPWFLTTSNGFYSFMNVYGALLGPMAGVMLADFLVIRKQKYNIHDLYVEGGQYAFRNGINIAGMISLAIGFVLSVLYLDLATPIGLAASFICYLILFRTMILPKYPQAELAPDYVPEDISTVYDLFDDED